MDGSAIAKVARAAILAVLSTTTALGFHMLAGGHAPHIAGIAVPCVLSFAVAVQLAGVTLTRWRVAVAAAASQLAFHFLFGLGAATGTTLVAGEHAEHDAHALHVMSGAAPMAGMHAMPLAHAAAALVTYGLIRRGDVLLGWIAAGLRLLARVLATRLQRPRAALVRARLSVAPSTTPPFLTGRRFAPVGMRAPPLAG